MTSNRRLLLRPHLEHGVDVEGLARTCLADELAARGAWLGHQLTDDAVAYLIETIWRLAQRYDPARTSLSFSSYAYRIGRSRVTDFYRATFGDNRVSGRPRPILEALNGDEPPGTDPDIDGLCVSIDLRRLSPRSRRTLIRVARPHADGVELTELAARFDVPVQLVRNRLKALRAELDDLGHRPAD